QLRRRLGHDFSQYKRSTMLRRIQRRMQVVGATTSEDYLKRLQEHDLEADLLFRDLLINVTCFFRDTESFDYLRREVIPAILAEKGAHDTVRIWTAGCSSGEEAYSIAILLAEALSLQRVQPTVQVFATDIDEPMLQKARSARYPHATVKDVPIELLDRYFYAEGEEYVLSQSIRDTVRVSNHNLLKDPPFSRIDLLICRNLLIYLNSALQQRLMPVFHYALRPQGWLFLGSAENIGGRNDLFETVDSPSRVYRRKGLHRLSVPMPLSLDAVGAVDIDHDRTRRTVREGLDPVSRRIMDRYAPVHVIVNPDNHVVRASSRTGKYLELATGAPSNNVTDLAKRGLRPALRSLLETVRKTGRRTMKRDLPMEGEDDKVSLVDVTADPLTDDEILLVFQDAGEMRRETDGADDVDIGGFAEEERARQLEDELDQTRHRLRTTVEELETSNEELKSSNEEMMSMNEELQSTNEELATVNEELNNKVDQLARANSDLENFIESTQVPTIFLDQKLQIRSFTPATKSLFRFQEQDRGRAFSDVASRLDQKELEDLSRKVLETGKAQEKEYDLDTGESYVLRILPYVDSSGGVTGVVLVFADVSKIRQTQADLARNVEITRHRNKEIVRLYETAPVGMALIDRNNRFLKVNERFADFVGRDVESHVGRTIRDIQPAFAERMEGCIAEVFEHKREVTNVDITARLDGEHAQDFLIDFFPYDEDDQTMAVGVIVKEVTEVKRLEREARRLMDELQHRVKNTLATVLSIINQTVKTKADKQDLVDALKNRIGALAATHDLLTQADWRSVPLQSIIDAELRPFDHQDRITLRGPTVMLPPKHALCITLTLHELATNAAKYGALAHPAGKLDLEWSVKVDEAGQRLTLHWTETGVPVAKKAPKDSFGAKLIRNAVKHDLKGQCDYRLAEDGVKCAISFSF
ncbi:MAG TPA: CheR family methyltransferase, partial [Hyphomonadaceae bacterium]|nr:CheR family methyltransferase [Hyphomonadaceae bacterium]